MSIIFPLDFGSYVSIIILSSSIIYLFSYHTEIYTKSDDGIILIKLDKSVYEKEAVMAAAYKLTNSCFIIVKPLENNQLGVYFEPKNNQSKDELTAIAKNYCNEVLSQQTRFMNNSEKNIYPKSHLTSNIPVYSEV